MSIFWCDGTENWIIFVMSQVAVFAQAFQFFIAVFPRLGALSIFDMVNVESDCTGSAVFALEISLAHFFETLALPSRVPEKFGIIHDDLKKPLSADR